MVIPKIKNNTKETTGDKALCIKNLFIAGPALIPGVTTIKLYI
jgi:hypothetical protein